MALSVEEMLASCKDIFDRSTQPFGVAEVKCDAAGVPVGFSYEYMNPAMAHLTNQEVEDLLHVDPYQYYEDNDDVWLEYFARAALKGEPAEFEAITPVLEKFEHVSVFPIVDGYCGFLIQEVTSWMQNAQTAMANVSAGIFYYDLNHRFSLLTNSSRKLFGVDKSYLLFAEVIEQAFGQKGLEEVREKMQQFRDGHEGSMLYEGRAASGLWLRVSVAHMGQSDRFAFGVVEDITHLKEIELSNEQRMDLLEQQTEALENALDLAKHANEAKSTFLTNMSHDFRTPMNSITGFANIALESMDDKDKVRDCLEKILVSSDHLLNLVNDILDVSRVESGKFSLSEDAISLPKVFEDIETVMGDQASSHGIDLTIDVPELEHPFVIADKLRLNQILVNTIGNAIKFTPQGGKVTVALEEGINPPKGYGIYRIKVKDTGCGMPKDFIDLLYVPFERSGVHSSAAIEGTGLGMTITKSLVDLMNGTIDVDSELDCGTEFTIRLPFKYAEDDSVISSGDEEELRLSRIADRTDFRGLRVLIADDDMFSREIVEANLRRRGFEVDLVEDGDEAIERVAGSAPFYYDALIMDIRMPRMNGDDAAREIRALDRDDAKSIPIIAATADAFEEVRKRAQDAGMTAHVTKPLSSKRLLATLAECLNLVGEA